MRRPRPLAAVLLAVPLLLAPLAADAAAPAPAPNPTTTEITTHDPDDTQGPLDASAVVHLVRSDSPTLVYKLRTIGPLEVRHLSRTKRTIVLELDVDGKPGSERNIRVSAPAGRLKAELISNATRKVLSPVDVAIVGRHTLRLAGSRSLIGARRYFWVTTYHFAGDPITRQDVVPNRGWTRVG